MKNAYAKKPLILAVIAVILTVATGCSEDPIFSAVEAEVKLKDPSVRGTVLSLVVYDGDLYTANGNLYRRTGGTGDWRKVALPAGVSRCSQVAVTQTDGTGEMFALFQNSDWEFHSLQRYTASGWIPVENASRGVGIRNGNGFIYFFRQNSIDTSEGARINSTVYRVDTAGTMTAILSDIEFYRYSGEMPTNGEGNYFTTNTGVYTYTGTKISTGENAPYTGIVGVTSNGSDVYAVNSGWVYHYNGSSWTRFAHDTESPVNGIAYLEAGGKHLLLIPGNEGYGEVLLDSNGLPVSFQDPGENSSSSIATSAEDQYSSTMEDWNIISMFVITDPVPAGNDYCLYAGIMDPEDDGLWSYYSNTAKEWNRE